MRERKILGVGSALVDILAGVDDSFLEKNIPGAKGGMEMVSLDFIENIAAGLPRKSMAPGGSAGNTVFGLANLGVSAAMLSQVGDDDAGKFYCGTLRELGGHSDEFLVTPAAGTGCCLSLITPDSERTMRSHLGASQLLTSAEASKVDYGKYEYVYCEGYTLFMGDYLPTVMRCAKQSGCKVALDLASFEVVKIFRDRLNELLDNYVDIIFANEDEAKAFFDADLSEENMAAQFAKRCDIAVVKQGRRGSLIAAGDKIFKVEPQLVAAQDTTGAGDLWATGFFYGLFTGKDLPVCGKIGSLVASEVVQVIGADIPAAGWNRIKNSIAKY